MKRTDVEEGILSLIDSSELKQELTTLDVYDSNKVNSEGQLLVITPAILLVPGAQDFGASDIYGRTYEQDMFITLLVAAENYRSARARRQGAPGETGVNEMLDLLRDTLRGQNPIADISSGARIHLVREEPAPDLGPGTVYALTVRVGDFLQDGSS